MRVTFYSNFLNHHQLPFCLEMYKRLGKDFTFVATETIPEERKQMGYEDMSEKYPFSINTYSSVQDYKKAISLGIESDVVIIGSAPDVFIKERLKRNYITFRYSERIFKEGRHRILNPKRFYSLVKKHTRFRHKNLYMLCASAYTVTDFSIVAAYKNKAFKWGYFPEVKEHDISTLMEKKRHGVPKILWVGRFLGWKNPKDAIKIASMLKKNGYSFQMDIIGTGDLEGALKQMIHEYNLVENVTLLGSMNPEKVRSYMESANIYLFTSDFNEGWGAVLNESMNSACAIVASHAIGSVPFLLKNHKNGLIYKNGDIQHLYDCVSGLLDDMDYCEKLGIEANKTLSENWNANNAATRIIELSESLLNGQRVVYEEGPCSKAGFVPHKYVY